MFSPRRRKKSSSRGLVGETYETLLEELSDRRFRLTYYHGILEIIAPSPEHELYKTVFGRFVETLAEEFEVEIHPLGSTTFKRPSSSGDEPDECFYTNPKNIALIRGKKRIDLERDPAPDLVLEIDITSGSKLRLDVYAELGVREVWVDDGTRSRLFQLGEGGYCQTTESAIFPNIPILEVRTFLERVADTDYLTLVRKFREWVAVARS
ncbi:Uma2 family endonuclease [Pannus brasiliensis CCIBt3594]|uniref:Uma2 family endonuclease n=1 Tax=Pannus brasiliensis CCIBt3594 TaxID=1427578 RepID=A0AAW9QM85_9CHRO